MSKIREYLSESSLSRIWQHVENKDSIFAVISAYQGEDPQQDKKNHIKLHNEIRSMGYGLIEFESQWEYDDGFIGKEKSFLVPNIKKDEALRLCKKYNQEAILYKDVDGLVELKQNGTVAMKFKSSAGKNNFTMANKHIFSKLTKGSDKGKPMTFVLKEKQHVNMASAYNNILNDEPLKWSVIYEENKIKFLEKGIFKKYYFDN